MAVEGGGGGKKKRQPETGHAKTGTPQERRAVRGVVKRMRTGRPDIGHTEPGFDPTPGGPHVAEIGDRSLVYQPDQLFPRHPDQIPNPTEHDLQHRTKVGINELVAMLPNDILDALRNLYGEDVQRSTIGNYRPLVQGKGKTTLVTTPSPGNPYGGLSHDEFVQALRTWYEPQLKQRLGVRKPLITSTLPVNPFGDLKINVPLGGVPRSPLINVPLLTLPRGLTPMQKTRLANLKA